MQRKMNSREFDNLTDCVSCIPFKICERGLRLITESFN